MITPKHEFTWEFLRRNPWYQADYQAVCNLSVAEGVTDLYRRGLGYNIFDITYRDQSPPSLVFHSKLYATLQKWGLGYYLPDPSMDVLDMASLPALTRLGNDCYRALQVEHLPGSPQTPIPTDGGIIPTDAETFWLFDINLPLEPQLKQAKEFLVQTQKRQYGKKYQATKTEPRLFLQYLRVLDADAHGVLDKEIIDVLFPDAGISYTDKNGRLYPGDTHRNPGHDNLKASRKGAYYLRNGGYRLMLGSG